MDDLITRLHDAHRKAKRFGFDETASALQALIQSELQLKQRNTSLDVEGSLSVKSIP